MRRFLSYLILCGATLVGVGASVAPVAVNMMDGDLAYADGQTLYFRVANRDVTSVNGNYTDDAGGFLTYDETLSKQPIEYVADTMRERLDAYGITAYNVETQGADTVAVTLRTPKDNSVQYSALQSYLTFSGGDYELDASNTTYDGYAFDEHWADIIDGETARIVDWEFQGFNVPTVVVPLKEGDDYKNAFTTLVDYCKNNTVEADEEKGIEAKTTTLVVWANRLEGDTNEAAEKDVNIASKIFTSVAPSDCVFYESADEDQENPSLRLIPRSAAVSGETYDATKTQEAYDAARAMMLSLNAGKFAYDELKVGETTPEYHVSFAYSVKASASVENLITTDDWNKTVAFSSTLIAVAVCAVILVVLLAVFERIMAALEVSAVALTSFSTFAVFCAFGAAFNIAALIGLATGSLVALFGTYYYSAKLKEEIYKGRTLKKAHTEAVKKALLPTFDASLIAIILGVCIYALAGDVASKAGVMLVLSGFFGFIINLLYTRIAGWLLANDVTAQTAFPKLLGVRADRIPDLTKEEKPSYFGPYAERDFGKGKKISLLACAAFLLAGIGACIGWGVATNGTSFFNSASYEQSAPVLRIEVRSNSATAIDIPGLASSSALWDKTYEEGAPTDVFHTYKVNDKFLADYMDDLALSPTPKTVYYGESDSGINQYWWYYEATFKDASNALAKAILAQDGAIAVAKWDGASAFVEQPSINSVDALALDIIDEYVGGSSSLTVNGAIAELAYVTFDAVVPATLTPYLWQIALGVGVGLAAALVYMVIRFRPSRGIVATLLAGSSAFIAVTFFVLTRISTLPSVALGSIAVAAVGLVLALFVLCAEKEIARESKEKDKLSLEFKVMTLKTATARQAGNVLLYAIIAFYVAVVFLAFGPKVYAGVYIAEVLGLAFASALVLTAMPFLGEQLMKLFSKIHLPAPKAKKKPKAGGQLMRKKTSAEPEESIFIGIND